MITAVLMAGGKSTRMGRDKCLIDLNGAPMWQHQLELLLSLSPEVFVAAPGCPQWVPANARWIPDAVRAEGPIGGLASALTRATHRHVLVLAVDMPAMTFEFLKKLSSLADRRAGVVPQIGGQYEPLAAIYPRDALPAVEDQFLVKGDNSLQALLRRLIESGLMHSYSVPSSEHHFFRNLNVPADCLGQ
ncbi:MAG TPA: molybdenum cofactor guanylyltransferase [Verrucomicrobiae bacterium]|jgi:molybdopterin-guanine dinucleotide biosynthesis protein A